MKEKLHALLHAPWFLQLVSYLFVGGAATLVEWGTFWVFNKALNFHYLLATALAYIIATAANWGLGRLTTFRKAEKQSLASELTKIYLVSAVGLLLNLGLMYVFVQLLGIGSMISKIMATILVFAWNFLSRKLWIYRV